LLNIGGGGYFWLGEGVLLTGGGLPSKLIFLYVFCLRKNVT
jgi:hypothetical protein